MLAKSGRIWTELAKILPQSPNLAKCWPGVAQIDRWVPPIAKFGRIWADSWPSNLGQTAGDLWTNFGPRRDRRGQPLGMCSEQWFGHFRVRSSVLFCHHSRRGRRHGGTLTLATPFVAEQIYAPGFGRRAARRRRSERRERYLRILHGRVLGTRSVWPKSVRGEGRFCEIDSYIAWANKRCRTKPAQIMWMQATLCSSLGQLTDIGPTSVEVGPASREVSRTRPDAGPNLATLGKPWPESAEIGRRLAKFGPTSTKLEANSIAVPARCSQQLALGPLVRV